MRSVSEKRWLLLAFAVFTVLCVFFMGGKSDLPATTNVQPQPNHDGRILVVPIQIERDSYGLAMVDTVAQTLWIYEVNSRGPAHSRLKLLAARSWRYDRQLQVYNTAEPGPEQVRMLLEYLGQWQKEHNSNKPVDSGAGILEVAEPDDRKVRPGG